MSLASAALWATVGTLLGGVLVISFAGSGTLRKTLLRRILRSNQDGWALIQTGNRYKLKPLEYDEDQDGFWYEGDEEEALLEDPADKMWSLQGVPVGLALAGNRPMVDAEAVTAAEAGADKVTDGGEIVSEDETFTLQQIQERLQIGHVRGKTRDIIYANPFAERDTDQIVDLRRITKLMANEEEPDAPRKAAKNEAEAERSFSNYGGLKKNLGRIAYLMIGGILTYIGTTSGGGGGGGGGGGVNVPISLVSDLVLGVL
jgi:hypothetical protein